MKSFGVSGYLFKVLTISVVIMVSGSFSSFLLAETVQFQNATEELPVMDSPEAVDVRETDYKSEFQNAPDEDQVVEAEIVYDEKGGYAPPPEILRLTAEGIMYYRGKGVAIDYKKAEALFLKAAEFGGAAAQYTLGYMYHTGQGVAQDLNRAMEFYKAAAA